MTIHVLPNWDVMLNALLIVLCGIILIFLIRNKLKYKQLILKTTPGEKYPAFENEILIQSLQQQTTQTFDAILNFIKQQSNDLHSYYEIEESDRFPSPARLQTDAPEKRMKKINAEIGTEKNAADHRTILQLSESGLTSRQISQKIAAPRQEVELVLRINARMAERETRNPQTATNNA